MAKICVDIRSQSFQFFAGNRTQVIGLAKYKFSQFASMEDGFYKVWEVYYTSFIFNFYAIEVSWALEFILQLIFKLF